MRSPGLPEVRMDSRGTGGTRLGIAQGRRQCGMEGLVEDRPVRRAQEPNEIAGVVGGIFEGELARPTPLKPS